MSSVTKSVYKWLARQMYHTTKQIHEDNHTTTKIHEGMKTHVLMDFEAIKNMKYILKRLLLS